VQGLYISKSWLYYSADSVEYLNTFLLCCLWHMQGGSRERVHGVHHLPTPKKAFYFVFAFTRFLSGAPPPYRNPGSPPPPPPPPPLPLHSIFSFSPSPSGPPPPYRNPGSPPPPLIWLVTDSEILFFLEYTTDYMLSNFKITGSVEKRSEVCQN